MAIADVPASSVLVKIIERVSPVCPISSQHQSWVYFFLTWIIIGKQPLSSTPMKCHPTIPITSCTNFREIKQDEIFSNTKTEIKERKTEVDYLELGEWWRGLPPQMKMKMVRKKEAEKLLEEKRAEPWCLMTLLKASE